MMRNTRAPSQKKPRNGASLSIDNAGLRPAQKNEAPTRPQPLAPNNNGTVGKTTAHQRSLTDYFGGAKIEAGEAIDVDLPTNDRKRSSDELELSDSEAEADNESGEEEEDDTAKKNERKKRAWVESQNQKHKDKKMMAEHNQTQLAGLEGEELFYELVEYVRARSIVLCIPSTDLISYDDVMADLGHLKTAIRSAGGEDPSGRTHLVLNFCEVKTECPAAPAFLKSGHSQAIAPLLLSLETWMSTAHGKETLDLEEPTIINFYTIDYQEESAVMGGHRDGRTGSQKKKRGVFKVCADGSGHGALTFNWIGFTGGINGVEYSVRIPTNHMIVGGHDLLSKPTSDGDPITTGARVEHSVRDSKLVSFVVDFDEAESRSRSIWTQLGIRPDDVRVRESNAQQPAKPVDLRDNLEAIGGWRQVPLAEAHVKFSFLGRAKRGKKEKKSEKKAAANQKNGKEGAPGKGVVAARREQDKLKRKLEQEQLEDGERQELTRQLLEAKNKEQAGVEKKSKDMSAAGANTVNVSHGAASYARLHNLYAKFHYLRIDEPDRKEPHIAVCKYSAPNKDVKIEEVAQTPVSDVKLSYFHAVAGMFTDYIGKKSPPKLSAIEPGKVGSILSELTAVEWMPNYQRPKK